MKYILCARNAYTFYSRPKIYAKNKECYVISGSRWNTNILLLRLDEVAELV